MALEFDNSEWIERYLEGDMNTYEAADFEKKIKEDEDLRTEFLLQKAALRAVRDEQREVLKRQIALVGSGISPDQLADYKPTMGGSSSGGFIKLLLVILGIIGTIIFILYMLGVPLSRSNSEEQELFRRESVRPGDTAPLSSRESSVDTVIKIDSIAVPLDAIESDGADPNALEDPIGSQ